MKEKHLPMFSEKFLADNNFEPLIKNNDEIQFKVYKNETHILGVDSNNTFGSIHLFKNKKNFDRVLEMVKENFTCYFKKSNEVCQLTETELEKKERQEKELEERHQIFLQKNRL